MAQQGSFNVKVNCRRLQALFWSLLLFVIIYVVLLKESARNALPDEDASFQAPHRVDRDRNEDATPQSLRSAISIMHNSTQERPPVVSPPNETFAAIPNPYLHDLMKTSPFSSHNHQQQQRVQVQDLKVGTPGKATQYAKDRRFFQRMQGFRGQMLERVENATCLHQGDKPDDLPSNNLIREHQRQQLPSALLIGVQKCGTTALYSYLVQHEQIVRSRKELYFLDEVVDRIMLQSTTGGIPKEDVRRAFARILERDLQPSKKKHSRKAANYIIDFTPNYIFESHRLPARIHCILPWAKVLVLLRNPIDRALSQYQMKLRNQKHMNEFGHLIPTFDEYVRNDLAALYETGVLHDWNVVDFQEFSGSPQEYQAWRAYSNSGLNAPVGMGLYAIQLRHFLQEFDKQGKPRTEFAVFLSEDLQHHTDATYGRVLNFLGLPQIHLDSYKRVNMNKKDTGSKATANNNNNKKRDMSVETEELLRQIFEPYNRQLTDLLGEEWQGVWT